MINWILENVTLPYLFVFIGGLLLGYFINWWKWSRKCKRDGGAMPKRDGFVTVVGIIIVLTMGWIMVSVGQARECSLAVSRSLTTELAIQKTERDAFDTAVANSIAAPAEIRALPQNDPTYQAYMKPIQDAYVAAKAESAKQREANQAVADRAHRACGE